MIALYIIGGFIALVLLVAAVVGTGWSFEKSVNISASPDRVWEFTNSLASMNKWNPWMAKDPNIKIQTNGIDGTPGASFSWVSDVKNVGEGSQTITGVKEKKEFLSRVDFIKPFKGTGQGALILSEENGGTKVSWRMESSTPYPMNIVKLFGLIEKSMDKDFGEGLNKLKSLCEG